MSNTTNEKTIVFTLKKVLQFATASLIPAQSMGLHYQRKQIQAYEKKMKRELSVTADHKINCKRLHKVVKIFKCNTSIL